MTGDSPQADGGQMAESPPTPATPAETEVVGLEGDLVRDEWIVLHLSDGREVQAKIDCLGDGLLECEAEGCARRFENFHARNIHRGQLHPELVDHGECENCGEPLEASGGNRFCSMECYQEASGVDLECENCGDEFKLPPSSAENRRCCSWECRNELGFEGWAEKLRTKTCEQCSREFETWESVDKKFCCRECGYEHRRNGDRPDDVDELLEELYLDEDWPVDKAVKRARAHLPPSWSDAEIEERLKGVDEDLVLADLRLKDETTVADVRSAVEKSPTMLEVTRELREPREVVRMAVDRLGLKQELEPDQDIYERARENLGLDDDDEERVENDRVERWQQLEEKSRGQAAVDPFVPMGLLVIVVVAFSIFLAPLAAVNPVLLAASAGSLAALLVATLLLADVVGVGR